VSKPSDIVGGFCLIFFLIGLLTVQNSIHKSPTTSILKHPTDKPYSTEITEIHKPRIQEISGKLSMRFEANMGQADDAVQFLILDMLKC